MKKKSYLRWVPALLPTTPAGFEPDSVKYPIEFAFWDKRSAFYYPYMLISMGLLKEPIEPLKDCFVMGDSGGYQYGTKNGEHLTPKWVIQTQEACCNMGFILDVPPYKNGRHYSDEWFERSLRITKENVDIMMKYREREDFKLYGAIQGNSEEQWKRWHDELTKDYDFDGWGIGFPNGSPPQVIVKTLEMLRDVGIKDNIHYFGLMSTNSWAMLAYAAAKFDMKNCTVDSATKPLYLKMPDLDNIIERRKGRGLEEFNEPLCSCQICKAYENLPEVNEQTRTSYVLIHNVYWWLMQMEWINALCTSKEDLKDFNPACKPFLDMIDMPLQKVQQKRLW